jgi:DMSO/TMAO reductase YedYZ heme-binding membrane subunit
VIAAIFIAYLLARVVTLRRMSTRRHHPGGVDASPRGA